MLDKLKEKRMLVIAMLAIVVLLCVGGTLYGIFFAKHYASEITSASKSLRSNDRAEALAHARKALALAPDDPEAIQAVAGLTSDSSEAKQLYAHELEVFKKSNNPDVDGKKAVTYWAAAGMAEQAGLISDAKRYYQKVIDEAEANNPNDQDIARQSKEALQRLK